MHPSEYAKAIYRRRARKDFAKAGLLLLLIALAIWLAGLLKGEETF